MTRKLVNIKNLLRIIISLFVIANMVKSCAKAVDFTTLTDYVNQTADFYSGNNYYQIIKTRINQPSMQSMLAQYSSNYEAMYVYCAGANDNMYVYLYTNPSGSLSDYGTGVMYIHGSAMILKMDKYMNPPTIYMQPTNNVSQHMDTCYRTQANKFNVLIGMNYCNYTYGNQILTYVGNGGYSPIQELEFENAIENTGYNGSLFTYYYKGDFYSNNHIFLGNIIPNDSYYFEVRLKDSKTSVIKGTSYVALNTIPYTFYNDSAIYINEDFEVYAIPRLLNYSTQYQLEITSYYGDGGNDLNEDIDWFIFLPQNATISGDVITSLGSGDFTNQNATNQIIDNQNQNNNEIINTINNIVGNLPAVLSGDNSGDASGDLSSGFDGGGGILGGIFSLFVPDGQFFKDYFEDLNNWFSERLGLLYFPIELTIDFLTRCLNIDFTTQVLSVGPYVLPLNDNFELVPEIEIDFNSFLEDETVNSIHEVYLFITDGLIIFGLYRLIIKKYNNIVKNKGGG